ncbi:MAG: hypothetical protein J6N19_06075 [Clostridium sp.]|nr:hypothetical protein [Clostridium sp.]
MIKADGIWAFHGTMLYDPPNPRGRKELKGDFVHRQFDGEGYWYDGWSSYDDRFCKDIREEMVSTDIFDELEHRLAALKDLVATGENLEEIRNIISNTETWIAGMKART